MIFASGGYMAYLMYISKAAFILLLGIISNSIQGQINCEMTGHYGRSEEEDAFNEFVIEFTQQGLHFDTEVHCLPVVFHIINDPSFDPARAHDQLERTDQHLRRTNIDTVNTRELFVPFATDCHIELELATLRPDGTPFNGLNHINVPGYELSMNIAVIAANMFDHTRYLNVWVFPGMETASGIFPWEATETYDGIMMGPDFVGHELGGNDPDAQGGKTFTHEIGHFLGLYHPFHGTWLAGECLDPDCENTGDRCCDTPLDYRFFPFPGDECTFDTLWCEFQDDIIPNDENYMFYNLDHCQNMFSNDQRTRMRAALASLRNSLTTASTHASTGIFCGSVDVDARMAIGTDIIIHPNPTEGSLFISYQGRPDGPYEFKVIDQVGNVLIDKRSNSMSDQLDLTSLSAGAYLLELNVDGERSYRRFIKQ